MFQVWFGWFWCLDLWSDPGSCNNMIYEKRTTVWKSTIVDLTTRDYSSGNLWQCYFFTLWKHPPNLPNILSAVFILSEKIPGLVVWCYKYKDQIQIHPDTKLNSFWWCQMKTAFLCSQINVKIHQLVGCSGANKQINLQLPDTSAFPAHYLPCKKHC